MASERDDFCLAGPLRCGMVASEREDFSLSGPLYLTSVDWANANHRRSVAASLVQGIYIVERDRQLNRQGWEALASPWWEFFHFRLLHKLVDDVDLCVFGGIFEYNPPPSHPTDQSPRYVIVFRGTVTKLHSVQRDIELDIHIIRNGLHRTSRFEIAMQAVRNMVSSTGASDVWLAGHSLGAAMALLAGKTMAKAGLFIQSFIFNPPFLSAPIEKISNKNVKHGLRFAGSVVTAGLAFAMTVNKQTSLSYDSFDALSEWLPCLFVNPGDHLCSEYIGYFEHRKRMEEMGAGSIEKLATQHSLGGLLMGAIGKNAVEEPLHLIPSAKLTVNLTPSPDFKLAHGIHQWWRDDQNLETKIWNFK